MRTCHRFVLALGVLGLIASRAEAQRRRYLIEVSAGPAYMTFDDATNLHAAFGGAARVGLWLPLNLSLEGEALLTSPRTTVNGFNWTARVFSGSLLGNIPVGRASSVFLRAGYGTSQYDSDRCDSGISFVDIGPCGSTPVLIGGPVQENKDKAAKASPVTYASADDPPFLIMHGDQDPLVPIAQNRELAEALKAVGVNVTFEVVKGAGHAPNSPIRTGIPLLTYKSFNC